MPRIQRKYPNIKSLTDINLIVDSDKSALDDYIDLQVSLPSLVYKNLVSIDPDLNAYVWDKHETLTYPLWTNGEYKLTQVYSSSKDSSKNYYSSIYSDSSFMTSSFEFDIAYGDNSGVGSTIKNLYGVDVNMNETKVVYSQYNSTINTISNNSISFNYPTWQRNIVTGSRIIASGTNVSGSLGLGNLFDSNEYKSCISIDDFDDVFAGYYYSSALTKDGRIFTWGDNRNGKLGLSGVSHKKYPTEITYSGEWKFLSSGTEHSLAIKKDGTLWAWGKNNDGQLGNGTIDDSNAPILIDSDSWSFVSAGNRYSCGVKSDGTIWTWGDNKRGQLGNGDPIVEAYIPAQINPGEDDWSKVFASCSTNGDCFTFGIKKNGHLYGWGSNDTYQLGLGTTDDEYLPQLVSSDSWSMVSAGEAHAIGIKTNNQLFIWGNNSNYQLGNATQTTIQTPTKNVINGDNWVHVNTSINSSIGIKTNGRVYVWGFNIQGVLGLPSISISPTPIVPFGKLEMEEDNLYVSSQKKAAICNNYNNSSIDGGHSLVIHEYKFTKNPYKNSNYIYVINVNRDLIKDKVEPGHWQLSLSPVDSENNIISDLEPITLIDDSSLTNVDIDERDYYNIYRGTLTDGLYTGSYSVPFGIFSPKTGTIILNGSSLYSFASILKPTNSSGINHFYTAISGAMSLSDSHGFIGRSIQRSEKVYAFVRIPADEFNYSNNPSYVDSQDNYVRKELSLNNDGTAYITTIGLYNDEKDLLAVAKLSRPIKKNKNTELVVKIKINF